MLEIPMKLLCREPRAESREPESSARNFSRPRPRSAFTLIEIMIVVGIIGLIAAMGVPSMLLALQKEGMRKAVGDVVDICNDARSHAILTGQTATVTFHPADRKYESSGGKSAALPNGMDFAMLDINLLDNSQQDAAPVRFFPNGTSDELTLVIHSADNWSKITLEFSTGIATVSAVDK